MISPILIPIFALMIPIIAIASPVLIRWIRFKEEELRVRTQAIAEKSAQYAAHNERLEQRVRVLERIATDRGADLAQEIDALRDPAPPPALPKDVH